LRLAAQRRRSRVWLALDDSRYAPSIAWKNMFRILTGTARKLRHYADRFVLPRLILYKVLSAAQECSSRQQSRWQQVFQPDFTGMYQVFAMLVNNASIFWRCLLDTEAICILAASSVSDVDDVWMGQVGRTS